MVDEAECQIKEMVSLLDQKKGRANQYGALWAPAKYERSRRRRNNDSRSNEICTWQSEYETWQFDPNMWLRSCNEYPKGVWTEPKIAPDRLYWRHVIVHKFREDAGIGKAVSNPNHFGIMPLLDMAKVYPEKFGLWCRHSRCHGQVAPWLSTK